MKDVLGHGSVGRSGIGLTPNARFSLPSRTTVKQSANDQVAGLRARLSAPKQGLAQTFLTRVKTAMGYST